MSAAQHRTCDYCGMHIGLYEYTCDKPECLAKLRVDASKGKCTVCDDGYYQFAGRASGHCIVRYVCDRCGDEFEKDVS